jgi:tripartite ATP-independent transporter DctM subunit
MEWWLTLALFLSGLFVFFFFRVPVALALFAVNMVAAWLLFGVGPGTELLVSAIESSLTTFVLAPIPLFILMGDILYQSGVINKVVGALDETFQRVPGRLPLLTVGTGAVFGVLSGSTSASTALLGRTMLPDMIRAGYPRQLALGSVLGSGGLAMIIPPSALAIIWGATAGVSIADLFIAGLIPGVLMASGYATIAIVRGRRVLLRDQATTRVPLGTVAGKLVKDVLPVAALVIGVLGSIFGVWRPRPSQARSAWSAR